MILLMQVCLAIGAAGLTVGSESGTISTFNPSTGSFTSSIKQAHDGHVTCIAQSPIGVVSGGSDGCVKLWTAGSCKHTFRDLGGAVVGVSVHPCGDYAAAAGESGCWAFYDLAYGTCRQVFAQNAPLSTGVFHPDGLIFATAEKGDALQLWDLKSERPALKFSAGTSQCAVCRQMHFSTTALTVSPQPNLPCFRHRPHHFRCLLREWLLHSCRLRWCGGDI